MPAASDPTALVGDREIRIVREYDAPRELIWTVWTDPNHIRQWWGPTGFTTTTHAMDVRSGGQWRFVMHGPDGRDYENRITYIEVDRPNRLVYKHGGGEDVEPVNFHVTVTFESHGSGTRLTMQMQFPSAAAREHVIKTYGALEGAKQTTQRLGEYLGTIAAGRPADPEFVIRRVFNAPPDLVWKAWTEREHLMKWFGPKGFTMSVARLDFRAGGTFVYCLQSGSGAAMWGKWVFREIDPPQRLVLVSSFCDEHGNNIRPPMSATWPLETLSTTTIENHAGIGRGTVITIRWKPLNATPAEIKTFGDAFEGMNQGWTGTFDQLAEYLAAI